MEILAVLAIAGVIAFVLWKVGFLKVVGIGQRGRERYHVDNATPFTPPLEYRYYYQEVIDCLEHRFPEDELTIVMFNDLEWYRVEATGAWGSFPAPTSYDPDREVVALLDRPNRIYISEYRLADPDRERESVKHELIHLFLGKRSDSHGHPAFGTCDQKKRAVA